MQSLSSAWRQLCSPSGRIVLWELWPLERTNSWVPDFLMHFFWLKIGRSDSGALYCTDIKDAWLPTSNIFHLQVLVASSLDRKNCTPYSLKFLHSTGDPDIFGLKPLTSAIHLQPNRSRASGKTCQWDEQEHQPYPLTCLPLLALSKRHESWPFGSN